MSTDEISYYERRLQSEIEAIEAQIRELNQEKYALQRQLLKARREMSGLNDVHRKNSINRVLIENKVIDVLKTANKPIKTSELYREAKHVDFDLKENTFRTHLHRMKNKGIIEPAGRAGSWHLRLNK